MRKEPVSTSLVLNPLKNSCSPMHQFFDAVPHRNHDDVITPKSSVASRPLTGPLFPRHSPFNRPPDVLLRIDRLHVDSVPCHVRRLRFRRGGFSNRYVDFCVPVFLHYTNTEILAVRVKPQQSRACVGTIYGSEWSFVLAPPDVIMPAAWCPRSHGTLPGQALAEKEGQHADNGDFHETLHGALIGADSDR